MKVTVCELSDQPEQLRRDWDRLAAHVRAEGSELVLLPEMPFFPWPAWTDRFDAAVWQASVEAHEAWLERLPELGAATVLGSRPVNRAGKRLNEGFVWQAGSGYQAVHTKYYLPDEREFWEATWYERGPFEFEPVRLEQAGAGFLICTEIWFTEHARAYARQGIHLLACPRATMSYSVDKWLAGGRAAAVMSGAYCLSSNRGGVDGRGFEWGGRGWIVEPEEARVLGLTSQEQPFLTLEIDLQAAEQAKRTYPRYVAE